MEITPEIENKIFEANPCIEKSKNDIDYVGFVTSGRVRFMANRGDGERLQQEHTFCIRYKRPVSYGGLNTYVKDYATIWLDVPHLRTE